MGQGGDEGAEEAGELKISKAEGHEVGSLGPFKNQGPGAVAPHLLPAPCPPSPSGPVITSFLLQGTVDVSPLYKNIGGVDEAHTG